MVPLSFGIINAHAYKNAEKFHYNRQYTYKFVYVDDALYLDGLQYAHFINIHNIHGPEYSRWVSMGARVTNLHTMETKCIDIIKATSSKT